MHLARRTAAVAALSAALLSGCAATPPTGPESSPASATVVSSSPSAARTSSADDAVDQVVAISVDGLNPDAIRKLGAAGTPALHRMLGEGAGTLNARTERELTRTLPNHTGMLTGRPVGGPDGHGVTFNEDDGSTLRRTTGHYVAGVFDVVHDRGGSTAFYSSKDKFDFLDRSWDGSHGAPDRVGADDGRDKLDRYVVDTEAANDTRLLARLRSRPDDVSFVHLAQPDIAGHAGGFMSPSYLDAVRAADRQVGRILAAVSSDPALRKHTTVVLTADHGGRGASHEDPAKAYDYTVPFLAWGVGVARGADLYALNAGRRERPGTRRTSYAGTQPIRTGEVANLVTDLLDLPDVPGSVFNRTHLLVR
jgi:predicted AlkP superfamily pyrophosphatase or phosphodiesterase